ncbi:MAG: hypothetical protein IPL58_03705 [Betaproteobacteria bacterium]|uniref:Acylneuraminate cytidylyltransferase n=1 Tax=Candidatus Proximibacter danicus TaxID=2954365 RepID=A0A9D7K2J8_9PROT|nr:hypothetical protein [Candidatus Proximibacter danicus]
MKEHVVFGVTLRVEVTAMNLQVRAWAFVPARGGSKSIQKKNIVSLGHRPMIEYGVRAAQLSGRFKRIICSTDDPEIAQIAAGLGVEIDWRPLELATDDASVADVAREFLVRHESDLPDVLGLIQPTSPFLLPDHVISLLDAMTMNTKCCSGQTITPTAHNSHAWNQRFFEEGAVRFMFAHCTQDWIFSPGHLWEWSSTGRIT